jgi:ATP-dependent Clp protease ATP-binding subunit ClpC
VLESYSDQALRVVSSATTQARQLNHPRVGTEHLLLGLLSHDDSATAEMMRSAGASLTAARHKVAELVTAEAGSPGEDSLPFTARAQRALERAGRFCRRDREPEVTDRHVLLGVLDVEGLGCQVLRGLSVDIVQLRNSLDVRDDAVASAQGDELPLGEPLRPRCPQCRASLDESLAETPVAARSNDGPPTNVSVVYCASCGATLGVLRPPSP